MGRRDKIIAADGYSLLADEAKRRLIEAVSLRNRVKRVGAVMASAITTKAPYSPPEASGHSDHTGEGRADDHSSRFPRRNEIKGDETPRSCIRIRMNTRRRYPSAKQIARLTHLARAAGISRVGAVTFAPDGAVRFTDAQYARTEEDEIAQAAADLEAALGAS